jgi:hypothetical protein
VNVGILAARHLLMLPGQARVVFSQSDVINSDADLEHYGAFLAGELYGIGIQQDVVSLTFASGTVDVQPNSLVLAVLL